MFNPLVKESQPGSKRNKVCNVLLFSVLLVRLFNYYSFYSPSLPLCGPRNCDTILSVVVVRRRRIRFSLNPRPSADRARGGS